MQNPTANTPKNTHDTAITATELYAIDLNPKFLAQSRLKDDGSVIMKWETTEGVYYTKSQVF